jgi:predicted nucleic acid-binding Zn ribbon protein
VRRRQPRPVAVALESLAGRLAPQTLLAEVQRAWPAAAGAFAAEASPVAERDGVVTVACASSVWAQELDLLAPRVVGALNARLGRPAVAKLRVTSRK